MTSHRIAFLAFTYAALAGSVGAMGPAAEELASIQKKMAPDQCELRKLSAQDVAARRTGDQGKRQELAGQMLVIVRRIQNQQPRLQELSQVVQPGSPDYERVQQLANDLRAQCKP